MELFLTIILTIFVVILIPVYWRHYGPQNFLWLSDVGLFMTVIALWTHSTLLMSMAAVGVFAIESLWIIDFVSYLLLKKFICAISDYMFESKHSVFIRALSLFHVVTPPLWLVYAHQHGYDLRAPYYFVPLYWAIITIIYWYTKPQENIDWVFFTRNYHIRAWSPRTWFFMLAIGYPLLVILPTHLLFQIISG